MTDQQTLERQPPKPLVVSSSSPNSALSTATYQRNRYLAQSVLFEESGLSRLVRVALLLVSLGVLFFFAWASYFTIDEVAHTPGQVISAAPVQQIQHLEGGIVQEILVQERDIVQVDQVLVRMDPQAPQAALQKIRTEESVLRAWQIRLQAFLDESEADFSALLLEFAGVVNSQAQLLKAQRAAKESQRTLLTSQAKGYLLEQEQLRGQVAFIRTRIKLTKEQKTAQENALRKGAASRQDLIQVEQQLNDVEVELQRNLDQQARAEKEWRATLLELAKREDDLWEKTVGELSKVMAELEKVGEGMAQAEDRVARLEVRSPVHGIIQNMPVKTVRGVLTPGALIAEIVPIGPVRYLEARIRTLDVGHLAVGQRVTVNVTAYDFSRYGGIDGTLESISPTTFEEANGQEPYYKGLIRLHKTYVGQKPKVNEVLPGMVVQADIHTGAKTLMEYLLKPIYSSIDQSFRER